MVNRQIAIKKIKKIFSLYTQGVSKRKISIQTSISRNTISKYLVFFNHYKLTNDEVIGMTMEELASLFKSPNSRLLTLEQYFPYFDKELKKVGVTQELLWREYKETHPEGYMLAQFCYWYQAWHKEASPVMHFTHKAGNKLFIDFTGKKLNIVDKETGERQELL